MADKFKNIEDGINLKPLSADPSNPKEGDLQYADGTARAAGLWQRISSAWQRFATLAGAETLTNKSIDADANTITNIKNAEIKAGAAIARNKLASGSNNHVLINDGSGVMSSEALLAGTRGGTGVSSTATYPTSGVIPTTTSTDTQTNKTFTAPQINTSLTLLDQGELQLREGSGGGSNSTGFKAPATLANDLIYTLPSADGSSGQVLSTNASKVLSWITPGNTLSIVSKAAAYTLTSSDDVILANAGAGAFTLTLPAAASNVGKVFRVVKTDSDLNRVTIDPNGAEEIFPGSATAILINQYQSISFISNGSNWFILSSSHGADSMVRLHTSNGYGSTNTNIARFSTAVINTGRAITWADSATLGASFTVEETGIFFISYCGALSASSVVGLSLNSTQLANNITDITVADRLGLATTTGANAAANVCWVGKLTAGDVIRAHNNGVSFGTTSQSNFTISKIGI